MEKKKRSSKSNFECLTAPTGILNLNDSQYSISPFIKANGNSEIFHLSTVGKPKPPMTFEEFQTEILLEPQRKFIESNQ